MEVVDDRDPAQVEQVLALADVAGTPTLPAADMGQGVLDLDPLTQLGPPVWGLLAGAQLDQECLVGVETARSGSRSQTAPV